MTPEIKVHRPARFALPAALLLAASSSLSAATISWDGDFVGGANNSGNWTDATNWSNDTVPVSPANTSDDVKFLDVTDGGTRIVSINNGETVTAKTIQFTQTTMGASNILSIASGGLLNLNSSQTWDGAVEGATSRVDLGGTIDFVGISNGTVTVNANLTFTNAGSVFRTTRQFATPTFNYNGAVVVNATGGAAQIGSTGRIVTTFGVTSSLSINSGTLEVFTETTSGGVGSVNVSLQGSTAVASGAEFKLSTPTTGFGSAGVSLTNSGTLTQAGKITTNGRGTSAANTLTNSGTWHINGLTSEIEKATNLSAADPTFVNTSTGTFTGSTANDRVDYNHVELAGTDLAFSNSGVIAAGNGSNGSGLSSVGTLTLVDFAVANTTDSALAFDIGGTAAGEFDVLVFENGSIDFSNAKLAINLVNGFAPGASFDLEIFTADLDSSVSGSFSEITVNGVADANYSFTYADGVGTLSYSSAIPEPSTYAVLAGIATLGLALGRRRGAKAFL